MDFGQAAKPSAIGPVAGPARADIVATRDGVAVELPEQTVQSAPAGDAVRVDLGAREQNDRADRQTRGKASDTAPLQQDRKTERAASREQKAAEDAADTIDSRIVIEPNTRSVVIQKRDTTTGETVELVPDAATLKLRIYARQQAERNQAASEGRFFERTA